MTQKEIISDDDKGNVPVVNPWIHIWFRTRDSLHFVMENWLEDFVHRLFMATGVIFVIALLIPDWMAAPPHPIGVMIQVLLLAPIGGIAFGYIFASFTRNITHRFNANVDHRMLRAGIAWTNLPFILAFIAFAVSYGLLSMTQPEAVQQTNWLFEGTTGWLPIIVFGIFYLYAAYVRINAIAYLSGRNMAKAALIWLVSVSISYLPAVFFGGTYYIVFRTTVGNVMQG